MGELFCQCCMKEEYWVKTNRNFLKKALPLLLILLSLALLLGACTNNQSMADLPEDASVCKLVIDCKTILDNMEDFNADKADILPEDGVILAEAEYAIAEGATAMDILTAAAQANDIVIDAGDGYVKGIANIYEFDCGEKSGWMYLVNGAFASVGADEYEVQEGDVISFLYSCDWGNDLPIEEPSEE